VLGVAGRAGDGGGAFHHVGVAHGPFVGLLGAHGAADNQRQAPYAEVLRQQAVLGTHIVADAHLRKIRPALVTGGVVR